MWMLDWREGKIVLPLVESAQECDSVFGMKMYSVEIFHLKTESISFSYSCSAERILRSPEYIYYHSSPFAFSFSILLFFYFSALFFCRVEKKIWEGKSSLSIIC